MNVTFLLIELLMNVIRENYRNPIFNKIPQYYESSTDNSPRHGLRRSQMIKDI